MPAKSSRRKRGKNLPPSKRIHAGTGVAPTTVAKSETKETEPAISQPKPVVARKTTPAPVQEKIASFPFIKRELLTIGILAVVMIAILVVLSMVL